MLTDLNDDVPHTAALFLLAYALNLWNQQGGVPDDRMGYLTFSVLTLYMLSLELIF